MNGGIEADQSAEGLLVPAVNQQLEDNWRNIYIINFSVYSFSSSPKVQMTLKLCIPCCNYRSKSCVANNLNRQNHHSKRGPMMRTVKTMFDLVEKSFCTAQFHSFLDFLFHKLYNKFTFTHLQHPPSLLSAKTAPGTNNVKYEERKTDFSLLSLS